MPHIASTYRPPVYMRQGDINTIYAARLRAANPLQCQRERIELEDGDFIDLDWYKKSSNAKTCVLLLHGLEGDSLRPYMTYMAELYFNNGLDVCAMNFRSCSKELNRLLQCYHSGKTDDVAAILNRKIQSKYENIILHGFSLGGNLALKFAAENTENKKIKAVIAVSAPIDLESSSETLLRKRNRIYERTFHKRLIKKLQAKKEQFPEELKHIDIQKIKNLREFDDIFTAPIHGFEDARNYYSQSSALSVLHRIEIPFLVLNALDDSFLSSKCYPIELARKMDNFHLETPKYGGHVGFYLPQKYYYSEMRSLAFVQEQLLS